MSVEESELLSAEERQRRNEVIRDLLAKLDAHAPGERAHAERVAVYAVATGEAMGLSDEELLVLRYAAQLHDIGKLQIDGELLVADRPLEPLERVLLEKHVHMAEEVLPVEAFLEPSLPLIKSHHERWSGEGYPEGASGTEIPLGARIIGAAEALDVMLAGAPWRKPFPEEAAIAAMKGLGGTWFDPIVVETLLRIQPLIQPLRA
ncbi:MAG: HD-GYP domain-containing protein [Fimbriimonas sp.]